MKRVLKSLPEPVCLTTYRNANPARTWNGFRDDAPTCYSEIRLRCRTDQSKLCAYCEMSLRTINEQIAHFHPKSDTTDPNKNWALTWTNLLLGCKGGNQSFAKNRSEYLPPLPRNRSCDEHKEDRIVDGAVLNPIEIPPFPNLFRFVVCSMENRPRELLNAVEIHHDEEGCKAASVNPELVRSTIEEFNLNCPRLAEDRFLYYRPIEQQLKKLRERNFDHVQLRNAILTLAEINLGSHSQGWCRYFTMVRWHLGSFAEDYLRSINYAG